MHKLGMLMVLRHIVRLVLRQVVVQYRILNLEYLRSIHQYLLALIFGLLRNLELQVICCIRQLVMVKRIERLVVGLVVLVFRRS